MFRAKIGNSVRPSFSSIKLRLLCVLLPLLIVIEWTPQHLLPTGSDALTYLTLIFSVIFSVHNLFTLSWMFQHWNTLEAETHKASPDEFVRPIYSFTALMPARHEENVIKDT